MKSETFSDLLESVAQMNVARRCRHEWLPSAAGGLYCAKCESTMREVKP